MLKTIKFTIGAIVTAWLLQACVPVFIAGAAVGGAAVYDRHNLKAFAQDLDTGDRIRNYVSMLARHQPRSHIIVAVFNHVVLLTGQSPTEEMRSDIERFARNTPRVNRIYDEITVSGPTSHLTRSSDAWITTKVRGAMLGIRDLNSTQFKVVTENGVVYLMGVVTHEQADLAVDSARHVVGVQKVVKVFEYE
jgi:osmotically-inducible protein OsmY